MSAPLLVLCTCPDEPTGLEIARHLVQTRLAACVNVLPGLSSVYRWQGAIETERETLLLAKTDDALLERLQQAIVRIHPYELPEIVAVPIEGGLPAYLRWLAESLEHPSAPSPAGS